jgi:fructokinase
MYLYGGVEAGGTKFVCATGNGPHDLERFVFPTTTPAETIARAVKFLRDRGPIRALGIAAFGPVDLHPGSDTYGYITSTPKPGWAHTDIAGMLGRALGVPVAIDTDVNAAALAETRWRGARGLEDVVYITVGTGIGGGALVGGRLVRGLVHPEMGHMRIPHDRAADPFPGICPFHGDCFEGLACGPAVEQRWGARARELPPDHPAWPLEAHYLALGIANIICTISPRRIILGGGIMEQPHLLPMVRDEVGAVINKYVAIPEIAAPQLGKDAGVLGAIALAMSLGG